MHADEPDLGATPGIPLSPLLRIDIVTLFPQIFEGWLRQGVVSRAIDKGIVSLAFQNLREFGVGRHLVTDDYPFGGGAGMVMKPEPLFASLESIEREPQTPVILLSPGGRRLTQAVAHELSRLPHLVLVSGHYEGVDERVRRHAVTDEISIGDYVLSAGELAAMVVVDAVVRLLPGALASDSIREESFSDGLLEYPHYTRPAEYRGLRVPNVLLSGNHGEIARWRRERSLRATFERRPDLLDAIDLTAEEQELVAEWRRQESDSGSSTSGAGSRDDSTTRTDGIL